MNRRLWAFLAIVVVLGGGALVYLWQSGWLSPSPGAVVRDTLIKANAGRFADAAANLTSADQALLARNPEFTTDTWKAVTKNGTIARVEIEEERVKSDTALVGLTIHYQDGSHCFVEEACKKEDGRWKHGIASIVKKAAPDYFDPAAKLANDRQAKEAPRSLAEEYTAFPGTDLSLRLPIGFVWDKKTQSFANSQTGSNLKIRLYPGVPVAKGVTMVEDVWKKPGFTLVQTEDVRSAGLQGKLFEGLQKNDGQVEWRSVTLVVGTEQRCAILGVLVPNDERFFKISRDTLLSVRWNGESLKQ